MKYIQKTCLVITILGAINWGLVGLFNFDLLKFITMNEVNVFTRILYCLVAIAGIINIMLLFMNIDMKDEFDVENHNRQISR